MSLDEFCALMRDMMGWDFEIAEDLSVYFLVDLSSGVMVRAHLPAAMMNGDLDELDGLAAGEVSNLIESFADSILGEIEFLEVTGKLHGHRADVELFG